MVVVASVSFHAWVIPGCRVRKKLGFNLKALLSFISIKTLKLGCFQARVELAAATPQAWMEAELEAEAAAEAEREVRDAQTRRLSLLGLLDKGFNHNTP